MKKNILILLAIFFTTGAVLGQTTTAALATTQSPGTKAKLKADKLLSLAGLTDDQYVNVIDACNRYFSQNAELEYAKAETKHLPGDKTEAKGSPATADKLGPTREEISTELNNRLKSILTEEQWSKAEAAGLFK
jgi:flagellar basal body-associated protein FliL